MEAFWGLVVVGLAVAGRAGWALVFTRLPVAAWAPTSPHSSLAPPTSPFSQDHQLGRLAGAALQQGFVIGTSATPGVEN